MNILAELKENIRLFYNKMRIAYLKIFTDKVKVVKYQDENGDTHTVTTEQREEKLCDHKRIEQLYGTFWNCIDCKDVYFEITYKVALNRLDLLGLLEASARHLNVASPLQTHDEE